MVFVDDAVWEWKGKKWCHLLADSLEELHNFAAKLGMRREWFQQDASYPHYDLTESKRAVAIQFGARAIGRRETIDVAKKLRNELHAPPKPAAQASLF